MAYDNGRRRQSAQTSVGGVAHERVVETRTNLSSRAA